MTDEQIVKFIIYRAQKAGQPLKLTNPKLVIYANAGSTIYLAVRFDGYEDPFFVRFTQGTARGIFKIKPQDPSFAVWKAKLFAENGSKFEIDYDLFKLPSCVKHFVSYAVIEALKTKGMGFDLFNLSFKPDPEIIRPSESYEEASIETDLVDFNFDFPIELTELPAL